MPRFYFDVIDQGIVDMDEAGLEFPDLAMAVEEAKRTISEMVVEATPGKSTASLVIQVRDGPEAPIVTVTASPAQDQSCCGTDRMTDTGSGNRRQHVVGRTFRRG